jgi:uncharacterized protein
MSSSSVTYVESIALIDRAAWADCFPGEVENYDYHRAVEAAGLEGFELGWYTARRDGLVVCAVPVFFTPYDLTTTAAGRVQRIARMVQPWVPGQLRLKLSCLGSPVTEHCPFGMHPILSRAEVDTVLVELLAYWAEHAASRRIGLLGMKDVSERDRMSLGASLEHFGLRSALSLPTATMRIDFHDMASYLARLSAATRKDIRRKLKRRGDVRVELRTDAGPYLEQINSMYLETRERSAWAFEKLSAQYFTEVLRKMGPGSMLVLYFSGADLLAANLLLLGETQLVDKFFVMRGDAGRRLNLYFLSWLQNIEICLARGLTSYVSGQGAVETKVRLGSALSRNWFYFKHQNPFVGRALGAVSSLLEIKQPAYEGAP